jgi:formylglycine-generating enzyme required for sulfatase activity
VNGNIGDAGFLRDNGRTRCDDDGGSTSPCPAWVSDFRLDTYEITVGRFRKFLDAGRGTQAAPPDPGAGAHPSRPDTGWDSSWNASLAPDTGSLTGGLASCGAWTTWTVQPGPNEDRPVNCLNWYEFFAFCIWDGGRLPTELEWDYAAAGGTDQRPYPWSTSPSDTLINCSYANYEGYGADGGEATGTGLCTPDGGDRYPLDFITVGALPKGNGRWGHADLSGNLWEFVFDTWNPTGNYPTAECSDCLDVAPSPERVMRNGAAGYTAQDVLTSSRGSVIAAYHFFNGGARCARAP